MLNSKLPPGAAFRDARLMTYWVSYVVLGLVSGFVVRAEVVELSFPKALHHYTFENIYENPKLKNQLSAWRRLEIDKKYKDCTGKGPTLIAKNKLISGWIISVWSSCVYKQMNEKFDQKIALNLLDNVRQHTANVQQGPWRNSIVANVQKVSMLLINEIEKNPKKNEKLKKNLMQFLETDEVYQNADVRRWFQTQLDAQQPSLSVSLKSKIIIDGKAEENSGEYKRLLNLDEVINSDSARAIVQIEPILDSLKQLYRKMEYRKIADLAPNLEPHFRSSELYKDFSMMLGRCYEFIGDYRKAMEYFKIVVNYYPTSADFEEAIFRSGMVQMRMGEMPEAQKYFQRLVQLDRDKYDITGRYWWLKTLQYNKDAREKEEKEKFANDFPFSYYGLRIKAELNEGKIKPAKGIEMAKISWSLTGKNAQVWQRFIKLSELGWILEAQQEMQGFSWPQNPLKVFYIAMVLAKADLHPLTVKNVTPLLETYSEVRSIDAIKDIYPKSYVKLILKEKERYPLHEHLILSLIRQESSFGLKALSTSNAAGLMQMIQPTAMEVAERLKLKIEFPDDLYRPEVNIPMGVFYIHQVIKELNQHVPLALAGYNAGPHKIKTFMNQRDVTKKIPEIVEDKEFPGIEDLWIDELPWAETTAYVKSILRNALMYELIDKGEIQYRPDFWRDFLLK
ncbi:MAG: transglycosylase SLT domain-containing protein [Bdellovibrionaceae bacterium]|nr:transglycosylase SLT domain-containing protein [Pseudobdellovibrionaceae bacterium]